MQEPGQAGGWPGWPAIGLPGLPGQLASLPGLPVPSLYTCTVYILYLYKYAVPQTRG